MDQYVQLAKKTIESYLLHGKIINPPADLPADLLNSKAGVFVSLHIKSDHSLRGCIGTFLPTQENIALEIINNALAAAMEDPRFSPVKTNELPDLEINVDVLSTPEPIAEVKNLDPKKYGLIVENQLGRKGLLLPDIGVSTVDEQIDICCQKGGIDRQYDKLKYYRFTVERHR